MRVVLFRMSALAIAVAIASGCALSYQSQIDSIAATDSLNQATAQSAPQQTVVNGWTARDFLELSAKQNAEMTLVLYGLLAMTVILAVLLIVVVIRMRRLETAVYRTAPPTPVYPAYSPPDKPSQPY